MDNLLNVNQVAFILKVHPLTVRRYLKDGRLKAIMVGGNVRIKESQLQDFSKDFTPGTHRQHVVISKAKQPAKIFSIYDPLFQLKGRVASLNLSGA
jgi:excisionase family DNA binding protein